MIVVQNHIPVAEGREDEFLSRFLLQPSRLDSHAGFIRNMVLRPVKGNDFIVLTIWEDEESFRAWTESDDFREAHSRRPPEGMITGKPELAIHHIMIDTEY